jgi:hypothetical protein
VNERIKELKHQASLWCDKNIPEQYSEETNSYGTAWEDKFAELLIQECATYVKNSNCFTYASQADLCAERMNKHFGVEFK